MRTRLALVATIVVTVAALAGVSSTSATTASYSDPGVLGVSTGSNWADMLTFTDPNVTATFSVTNTNYKAVLSDNTCMDTDSCLWWGTDDTTGDNCWDTYSYVDTDCDDETSLVNSVLALTPSSVSAAEGVTWTWRSPRCGDINTMFPTPSNPIVDCPNVSTVTIQFSAPVSNAIIHLNNIGGNGNYPAARKNSLTTGFDMTLFSKWELTSGQSMVMLSGSETTNIMLDGNTIRNRYTPNGLGARVSNRECGFNEIACQYDNGTGSGSFLVLGTYSTLTFDIDLGWALGNYGPNNPPRSRNAELVDHQRVQLQHSRGSIGPDLVLRRGTGPSRDDHDDSADDHGRSCDDEPLGGSRKFGDHDHHSAGASRDGTRLVRMDRRRPRPVGRRRAGSPSAGLLGPSRSWTLVD